MRTVTPNYFHALLPAVLLLAARCTMDARFRRRWFPPLSTPRSFLFLHLFFLGLAFILSFGLSIIGPYRVLYKYVPGFDGLRAAPRIHIITMLSIAVLAAFGMKAVIASRRKWVRGSAAVVLPLVALVEYNSIPVPSVRVPVKDELPAVYGWLADEAGEGPILELPLPLRHQRHRNRLEIFRVYCSTLHWRRMVNGYSGFFPPLYLELRRRWEDLPPRQTIHDAQLLGVRYVILHTDEFDGQGKLGLVRAGLAEMVPASRLVRREGPAEVWELAPGEGATGDLSQLAERPFLPREGWVAQASVNGPRAMRAVDNRIETWWNGGPLEPRTWFSLDLRSVHPVRGIELKLGNDRQNFPHGFVLEVSTDGESWRVVSSKELTALPITAFLRPKDLGLSITFEPTEARFLKITNTTPKVANQWFIHEIDVW